MEVRVGMSGGRAAKAIERTRGVASAHLSHQCDGSRRGGPCAGRPRATHAHQARVWPGRGALDKAARVRASPGLEGTTSVAAEEGSSSETFDLVVVGAGPSGLAVAERLASQGKKVCVVDPEPRGMWPNNYGVWIDEFEQLGLADCIDFTWDRAVVHLDSTPGSERELRRPYGRVDRAALKGKLLARCETYGVTFREALAREVEHFSPASPVAPALGKELAERVCGFSRIALSDGSEVRGKFVLDATGHAKKFATYSSGYDPGYQGAYGIMIDVDSHPFDNDAMLFMDWRDDHLDRVPELRERNRKLPTFLYAMPFSDTSIFVEETSLVARPAVPFDDLKERLGYRLDHLGIKVNKVHEEEFCLIPMGSSLPRIPQRVLGIGGTAGQVHPSTGYMVARMLGAAPVLADAILDQLGGGQPTLTSVPELPSANGAAAGEELEEGFKRVGNAATGVTSEVWRALWPDERLQQREFFNFGMEILLSLDLLQTRKFFSAFFDLSDYHWQGFLSSRLSFPELIVFGLSLFSKSSWEMRGTLVAKGIPGLVPMATSLVKGPTPEPSEE